MPTFCMSFMVDFYYVHLAELVREPTVLQAATREPEQLFCNNRLGLVIKKIIFGLVIKVRFGLVIMVIFGLVIKIRCG